jgi:hypothetical protein
MFAQLTSQMLLGSVALLTALMALFIAFGALLAIRRRTRAIRDDIARELERANKYAVAWPLYVETKRIASLAARRIEQWPEDIKDTRKPADLRALQIDAFWLTLEARKEIALLPNDINTSVNDVASELDRYNMTIEGPKSGGLDHASTYDEALLRVRSVHAKADIAARKLEGFLSRLPPPSFPTDAALEITTSANIDDYEEFTDPDARLIIKVTIAADGAKWRFHKSDIDPWPSELHGHNIADKTMKLDATNGHIWLKRKFKARISSKELMRVQNELLENKDLSEKARRVLGQQRLN